VALSDIEDATFRRLSSALTKSQRDLERLDAYYEGIHRLEQLGLAVPPELGRFVTTVNWPRITVDSLEQRCDVEGFRLTGQDSADDELWSIWQSSGMDEESQQAHLEALIFGRSYVCVGTRSPDDPDPDVPLITVESPYEMTHEVDPRTRRVTAALRRTKVAVPLISEHATLYLPNETVWLQRVGRSGWVEVDRDEHNIGRPLVVPLLNRSRLRNRQGSSEMADVLSLTDAACRALDQRAGGDRGPRRAAALHPGCVPDGLRRPAREAVDGVGDVLRCGVGAAVGGGEGWSVPGG
jgi:hypothetical protein